MMPTRSRAALLSLLVAGCGGGTTSKTDGGADGSVVGRDMAVLPAGCSGTLKGALNGKFASCTISITQGMGDQTLQLIPGNWTGDAISTFQIALVLAGGVQVKSYKSKDIADGSIVTVVDRSTAARYLAQPDPGGFQGQLELNVASPPKNPGMDTTWADKSTHGALTGTLVHDPNTTGDPAATVALSATF